MKTMTAREALVTLIAVTAMRNGDARFCLAASGPADGVSAVWGGGSDRVTIMTRGVDGAAATVETLSVGDAVTRLIAYYGLG
jgi:hypothetical protein